MRWAGYSGGVVTALLHVLAAWLVLVAGFAFVVRQTGEPGSALVVALFISLPILIQGVLVLLFGSYRRVPELGWIVTGMLEVVGAVFLLFLLLRVSETRLSNF